MGCIQCIGRGRLFCSVVRRALRGTCPLCTGLSRRDDLRGCNKNNIHLALATYHLHLLGKYTHTLRVEGRCRGVPSDHLDILFFVLNRSIEKNKQKAEKTVPIIETTISL